MPTSFRLFPESASTMADQVDRLFFFLVAVAGSFTLIILVLIVYFALKYRRRSDTEIPPKTVPNYKLEITWTVVPLVLAMIMFGWGAHLYVKMFNPPPDAMEIYVIGKQWMWKIQHPEGRREIDSLHVPVGRPIKLVMSSEDVIHDFFVPAFRIKHDVLPGRYTSIWFTPTKVGEYHFFCSQYCGTGHSGMVGTVVVMEPADYQAWLSDSTPGETPARSGEKLYEKFGCNLCHGQQAPTLAGLYGSKVELEGGGTVVADDAYIRESILDSTAKIVKGYPPIMPSYRGQVSEVQLLELVEYIKSLKNPQQDQGNVRKP
jgi:cytochrome c oxidase subunit II